MATTPDKPKPILQKPAEELLPEFMRDSAALPDVVESDSDTAWGRWEDTLQASEQPPEEAEPPHTEFSDTIPLSLEVLEELKRPKK
jgi:hypothetical protein